MNGTIETVLRDAQQSIKALDKLVCARLKRTVKVEIEMRDWARREDKADSEQLLKWAVMLGVPEEMQIKPCDHDLSDVPLKYGID